MSSIPSRIRWIPAVFVLAIAATPVFPQTVGAFAEVSVCDVPGTNQVIAQGVHIAGESGAEFPHSHTKITVGGVMRSFSLAGRCENDFGAINLGTCSASTTEINGQKACSTTGSGSCTHKYSTKSIPTHVPTGGAYNEGFMLSSCAAGDCVGDEECNPFTGMCF